jgi:hypothetical protein
MSNLPKMILTMGRPSLKQHHADANREKAAYQEAQIIEQEEIQKEFDRIFKEIKTLASSSWEQFTDIAKTIRRYSPRQVLANSVSSTDLDDWQESLPKIHTPWISSKITSAQKYLKSLQELSKKTTDVEQRRQMQYKLTESQEIIESMPNEQEIERLDQEQKAILHFLDFEEQYRKLAIQPAYQLTVIDILKRYNAGENEPNYVWATQALKPWSQNLLAAKQAHDDRVTQFENLELLLERVRVAFSVLLPFSHNNIRDFRRENHPGRSAGHPIQMGQFETWESLITMQQQLDDILRQRGDDRIHDPDCQKIIEQYYYQKSLDMPGYLKNMGSDDIRAMRSQIESRHDTRIMQMNSSSSAFSALERAGIQIENEHNYYIIQSDPCLPGDKRDINGSFDLAMYYHAYNPETGVFLSMRSYRNNDIKWEEEERKANPDAFKADYPPPAHVDDIKFYHIQRATEQYMKDKQYPPGTFRPKLTMFIGDSVFNNATFQVLRPYLSTERAVSLAPGTKIYAIAHVLPSTESNLRIVEKYWPYFSDRPLKLAVFQAGQVSTKIDFIQQTVVPK